jgi:molybdopterin synthase sulfur carrier subunit
MLINFYASLRKISGQKTVDLVVPAGSTVAQMIDVLLTQYPEMREKLLYEHGNVGLHAHVFVNGRDAPLQKKGMDTVISAGSAIDIFPLGHF